MRAFRVTLPGVLAVSCLLASCVPASAAVRPPKMNAEVAKLPNGLTIVLL